MSISPIIDAVDVNGYLSILAYVNYFVPGRLKLHTRLYEIDTEALLEIIERSYEPWDLQASRRWLQKGEMPYPGYCRSPGSEKCLPVLCNCKKLKEIWNKIKHLKSLSLWNNAAIVK